MEASLLNRLENAVVRLEALVRRITGSRSCCQAFPWCTGEQLA
jgi:hypothetical protein